MGSYDLCFLNFVTCTIFRKNVIFLTSDSTAIAESFADDVDNKGSSNSSKEISGTISGLQKKYTYLEILLKIIIV